MHHKVTSPEPPFALIRVEITCETAKEAIELAARLFNGSAKLAAVTDDIKDELVRQGQSRDDLPF